MQRVFVRACCAALVTGIAGFRPAVAQSRSETPGDCGADICLQAGVSYWRYDATQYCESDVCLRDRLEDVADLDWDRLMSGRLKLIGSNRNPFIGIDDTEYRRFRDLAASQLRERIDVLRSVRATCQPIDFSLRLDVPGYDIVVVTFGMPLAGSNDGSGFQVTEIRRTFRNLPGGSVGWWVRWISSRFPGIPLLDGDPAAFASYEIGLYMGGLVLHDIELEPAAAEAYAQQSACR